MWLPLITPSAWPPTISLIPWFPGVSLAADYHSPNQLPAFDHRAPSTPNVRPDGKGTTAADDSCNVDGHRFSFLPFGFHTSPLASSFQSMTLCLPSSAYHLAPSVPKPQPVGQPTCVNGPGCHANSPGTAVHTYAPSRLLASIWSSKWMWTCTRPEGQHALFISKCDQATDPAGAHAPTA